MAAEPQTFRSITVRNFRGFRDEQTVDLDSSAVIISGPNGTGKTSFLDSIQWLLTGELPRLAELTSRRSDDHVVNRFRQDLPAYVAAEVWLRGESVRLVREGNAKASILEWSGEGSGFRGEAAEKRLADALLSKPGVALQEVLLTSGILQQDAVRLVLQDEPKNRYRHMASLLGLQELAGFEDYVKQSAESSSRRAADARAEHAAAEEASQSAEAELRRLQQRLAAQPELAGLRRELLRRLQTQAPALVVSDLPQDLGGATAFGQAARHLRNRADQLLAEHEDLAARERAIEPIDEAELVALAEEVERARAVLRDAERTARDARSRLADAQERSGQLEALATRALPLLGTSCPVCEQSINPSHVAGHLRQILDEGGAHLTALEAAAAESERLVRAGTDALQGLEARLETMSAARKHASASAAARTAWLERCARLEDETKGAPTIAEGRVSEGDAGALATLRASADALAGTADELVNALGASTLAEQAERQRTVVQQQRARADALREAAATLSQRAEEAKTLRSGTTRATAAVTAHRFAQLQPLVNEIFGRLDPHPIFTKMRFELDVSYRAGVADPIVEDEEGTRGDPLLIFSSSQANVAALTYFLALSWTAEGHALPFLLLDDPLQSMDDVNVLGFSDLCRHIRRRRQLIVSTHEQRLAGLIERKLAPRGDDERGLRVIRFVGWDRAGPKIDSQLVESHDPVRYLLGAS